MNTRKLTLTTLATLCAMAGVLVLSSIPAFASAAHVFSKSFGSQGSGPGQFKEPEGVAVNEATVNGLSGDVYVADKGNNRVEYFTSEGEYKGEFNGTGKLPNEGSLKPLTPLEHPESIAIDDDPQSPSYGDVYVADLANGIGVIDKFSSTGAYINQVTETPAFTEPNHGTPFTIFAGPLGGPVSGTRIVGNIEVATGADGELWVEQMLQGTGAADVYNFSGALTNVGISGRRVGAEIPVFAVDSRGNFYVAQNAHVVVKYNSSTEPLLGLSDSMDTGSSTSIAVEQSTSNVYVDYGGAIARFNSEGVLGERFGFERLTSGSGVAVDSTGAVYVADTGTGVVDVYDNAASAPSIEGEAFSDVTAHAVTLSARVNTNGLPTTYAIEYGTSEAYGSMAQGATLEGSFRGPVDISARLESALQAETTYHFRIVATNKDGVERGPDIIFTTLSDLPGLPDSRGYELVSPVANADGNVYLSGKGGVFEAETSPLPTRASVDGNAVEYVASPLASGGNGQVGAGQGNQFVAMRNRGGGWSTVDLGTPGVNTVPFEALFSSELSNSGAGVVAAGSHSLSMSGEGLFDSVGGRSVLVSVLPPAHAGEPGVPVASATFGGPSLFGAEEGSDFSHVISADGSRVFWTALEGTYNDHLFVRENDSRTVPVSVGAAQFWTASNDGRYVFYTEGESLWRFDVESETREELAGEGAGVLGVIGVNETGEDGAYLYFVAKGVLAPGAKPGDNLYVRHDGMTAFVITLAGEIIRPEGGSESEGVWVADLRSRTAEVSANGHAVVFTRGLAKFGSSEVYVYEADTGRVSCVSCNPSGAPGGQGSLPRSFDGERTRAQNDTAGVFLHRWVSGDGKRAFFESGEALVAQDTNGKGDVYEWEQAGSGSCLNAKGCIYLLSGGTSTDNSHLLDASASGDDVFIITRADLTSQDQGETFEVYDARVGALQPPGEPSCTGTGCQGLPSAPPLFATPSSVTFNGVGNFTSSSALSAKPKPKAKPVKCRKGFIKRNGRCVKARAGKSKAKKSTHQRSSHRKGSK